MNDAGTKTLRVLCMTWNTQSVRLAECSGSGHRAGSWLEMSFKRYDPDFLPALMQKIVQSECDLFVCALQESAKPGSHFISDSLPTALAEIGFELIHRTRLMGVGATTFQQLCREGDLMARGLRMAVYAKREWTSRHTVRTDENWWHATNFDVLSRGKGAIAICLYVRGLGRLCLMNCHLPFNARSVALTNSERVISGMSDQVNALRSLISRCRAAHAPHYLILLGDLNFRVLNFSDGVDPTNIWSAMVCSAASRQGVYERRDELRAAIGYRSLPPLQEGIDNSGPYRFMPTGKMRHGRQSGCIDRRAYYFGHGAAQNPSWCDRILYARNEQLSADYHCHKASQNGSLSPTDNDDDDHNNNNRSAVEGSGTIECTMYDRFEAGQTMTRSDHSAVIGCYVIKYNCLPHCCSDSSMANTDISSFVAHDCGSNRAGGRGGALNNRDDDGNGGDEVVVEFIDSNRIHHHAKCNASRYKSATMGDSVLFENVCEPSARETTSTRKREKVQAKSLAAKSDGSDDDDDDDDDDEREYRTPTASRSSTSPPLPTPPNLPTVPTSAAASSGTESLDADSEDSESQTFSE